MPLVFVYGTLKSGGSNHGQLIGQKRVGLAATRACYRLYALDGYPGLVEVSTGGRAIEGEIWDVNAACLERLDRLEGVSLGLYARRRIGLKPPHSAFSVEGYVYLRSIAGRRDLGTRFDP